MSSNNRNLANELDAILSGLTNEDLANVPANEVLEMRKKINPYGRTIEGSNKYLNFSITQIHHEYWKKFIITAFVGFLNRMNDEWKVPEGVPVVPVYDYLQDKSKADTPEMILKKGEKSVLYDYEFNRKWMEKRIAVKEFLEEMFQFNPDEHVRSGYIPNRGDKERKPIDTPAGKLAVAHLKKKDKDFRAKEELYEDVKNSKKPVKTKKVRVTLVDKKGNKKTIIREVPDLTDDKSDNSAQDSSSNSTTQAQDSNSVASSQKSTEVTKKTDGAKDPTVSSTVRTMIPPHDVFGRFKVYFTNNYEELRDAVRDLYCEKPELELAINPYAWHNTKEEAETFKKKHANEVISEIFTVDSGKWNFFDTFKEQRDSVNFYNDKTIILEEMIKQHERDEKLGQDLMNKRIEKTKRKNIIEAGPDAESFKKWRQQNAEVQKLGASHIGDMADPDCPADGLEVGVWKVAKGGLEVTKEKFFTLAEAPTFVKEAQDKAIAGGHMKPPMGYTGALENPNNVANLTANLADVPKVEARANNLQ